MIHSQCRGGIDFSAWLLGDGKEDVAQCIHMVLRSWKGGPPVDTGLPDSGSGWKYGTATRTGLFWESLSESHQDSEKPGTAAAWWIVSSSF